MAPTGTKRRATSVPPAKKTKVEIQDPVSLALSKVCDAINGDLKMELPPKVVQMVLNVAPEALSAIVEERSDL